MRNLGCGITTPSSFGGATPTDCIGNNRRVSEVTVGFWQNLYKGNWGRVTYGAQYEYVNLKAFAGAPGPITATSTPNQGLSPNNQIVMMSLRYYPYP